MPQAITNVNFYCSPLNPNGLFTMSFENAEARESYFASVNSGLKADISITTGTYARKDGVLTVGVNETVLNANGINYVRFNNPQFNGKWFYAFVRKIEYVNPQTSRLYIDTDVFMTYQFDIDPNEVFIERETVGFYEELYAYRNLLPEPVSCNGYMKEEIADKTLSIRTETEFYANFDVAIVVSTMNITGTTDNDEAKARLNSGSHYIDGCALGGSLLIVKTSSAFKYLMECLVVLEGNIISVFPIEKGRVDDNSRISITYTTTRLVSGTLIPNVPTTFDVYTIFDTQDWQSITLDIGTDTPSHIAFSPWWRNYTIRNHKLFTYPYVFIVGDNHSGSETIFRYDLFEDETAKFRYHYLSCPAASFVVEAEDYEGVTNVDNAIINPNIPQVPYEINSYSRYMAQNYNSLVFGAKMTAVNWAISFASDIGSLGVSSSFINENETVGDSQNLRGIGYGMGALSSTLGAVNSLGSTQASLKDMAGIGNSSYNIPSGSLIGYSGDLGITIYRKFICIEDAKRIDSFFDRYGYRVDRVEELSWDKRTNYDYIKTSGCNVGGEIPADDKAKINNLFDTGITIWHKSEQYGKYAKEGRENTPL